MDPRTDPRETSHVDTVGVLLLHVHDFPRMLAFYRDTMQLPVSEIKPGDGLTPLVDWVRFELRGTALELFAESTSQRAAQLPLPRNNAVTIAFRVEDIRAAYETLRQRGVAFPKAVGEADWGWYVHFQDPEGNRLQLYQPRPGY
jgi:predicted enzyme related to lactoylglutathione lyase